MPDASRHDLPRRVLLVDDHSLFLEGLRNLLVSEGIQVVGLAKDGLEALAQARRLRPDVILMDIQMPRLNGIQATRQIMAALPRTQIIILTSFHQDEFIFPALQAGAIAYLLKDVKAAELVEAIRRAARGEATLHPRIASRVIKTFSSLEPEAATPFTLLTEREMEVLRCIARGRSNKEIGSDLSISEKTVKTHITNILSKLHLADRTQAAVYAWQEGFVRRNRPGG